MSVHPSAELRDHAAGAYRLAADRARKVARYAQRLAEGAADGEGHADRRCESDELRHELGELVVLIDIAGTYEAQAEAVELGGSGRPPDAVEPLSERDAGAPAPGRPFTGLPHSGQFATERRARAVDTARRVVGAGAAPTELAGSEEEADAAATAEAAPDAVLGAAEESTPAPERPSGEPASTQELAELDRRLEHLDRVAEDLLRSFEQLRERFLTSSMERAPV